jgi:hypothetical protein
MTTQFQVGRTYSTRSIGDHECIYSFTILKRTAKSVTVEVYGKTVRRGVYEWHGVECFKPFGTYSMCAIIHASDSDLSQPVKPVVSEDDKIRAALVEAKPALDYAKAVRERDAMAAPRAMLAALKRVKQQTQSGLALSFADLTAVCEAIEVAEAAGITAEDTAGFNEFAANVRKSVEG